MYMSFFVIMIGPDEKLMIKKRPKCHHNLKICIWHLAKFPQIINVLAVYLHTKKITSHIHEIYSIGKFVNFEILPDIVNLFSDVNLEIMKKLDFCK